MTTEGGPLPESAQATQDTQSPSNKAPNPEQLSKSQPPVAASAKSAAGQLQQHMPLKQKVAVSFQSLLTSARKLALGDDGDSAGPASAGSLFAKTDPAVDGDDCLHDCNSCTVRYPRNFKTEEHDLLYGHVKAWSTHLLVATGKTDWVRDVEHEKGSVMEAVGRAAGPSNGVRFSRRTSCLELAARACD